MTVESQTYKNQYNCDGSQTVFPYTFRILDASHLRVVLTDDQGNETDLALNTDYTVDGVGNSAGGNVTTVQTYATGYKITIVRNVPLTQTTDYVENDPFPAETHEDALDKLTMINQQQTEQIERSLKFPLSDPSSLSTELPPAASRASKFMAFDANGEVIASAGSPDNVPVSSFMATVLDDPDAATARQTLEAVSRDASLAGKIPKYAASGDLESSGYGADDFMRTFRNKIINGNFDFWQRGTTISTSGTSYQYAPDRWRDIADGTGGTRQWSRQSFTLGQTDVPGEPEYFARIEATSAYSGSTYHYVEQCIESVRTLAGQTVVVSGYIKADSSRSIPVKLVQHFGSGGSPSSDVSTDVTTISATTSWQRFEASVDLPSISGKTLGYNGDDCLILRFELPVNTTFQVDLARIQLEKGSVATDFEERPKQVELALCQRYYCKSYDVGTAPGTSTYTSCYAARTFADVRETVRFPVPMRATPTITIYSPQNGSSGYFYNVTDATNQSASSNLAGSSGFHVGGDAGTDNRYITFHFVADAEF